MIVHGKISRDDLGTERNRAPWFGNKGNLCVLMVLIVLQYSNGCGGGSAASHDLLPTSTWPGCIVQEPVNRAPMAKVDASSVRIGLLPYHGRSFFDRIPITWPQLIPRYVQDRSLMTRWASEPNECPFLMYDLGAASQDRVPIHRIVLHWAEEVPREFAIEASATGDNWVQLYRGRPSPHAIEDIMVHPPALIRWLKLASLQCPVRTGISLFEMAIYGPPDTALPLPVSNLRATSIDSDSVRLVWEPGCERAFCYQVYRLPMPDLAVRPRDHLVGMTRKTEFLDLGLTPETQYYYRIVPETFSGSIGSSTTALKVSTSSENRPASPFEIRGVVEGFYNQPWSHLDRLDILTFLGAEHMNYYLYAPKVEGFHRAYWREPYPEDERKLFKELIERAKAHNVTFCYGLSPGMDFQWDDPREVERLLEKFSMFYELGVRAFALLFDDTPDTASSDRAMGQQHVWLVTQVYQTISSWSSEKCTLIFVPTIYFKTIDELKRIRPSYVEYLAALADMPPPVLIAWVGPGMPYSGSITKEQALEFSRHIGRKVLIWDNYPANDNFFLYEPFFGPYRNRSPDLHGAVAGILSNPMNYPQSSMVPLATFARYLADPYSYDPKTAFEEALQRIGSDKGSQPLRTFALQFYGHPIIPPTSLESPELAPLIDSFWEAYPHETYPEYLEAALKDQFLSLVYLVDDLKQGLEYQPLLGEIEEAAEKLALYGQAGLIALKVLRNIHQGAADGVLEDVEEIRSLLEQAMKSPWRAAENYANGLMALLFGCRPVKVDVIGTFLRRTIELGTQRHIDAHLRTSLAAVERERPR